MQGWKRSAERRAAPTPWAQPARTMSGTAVPVNCGTARPCHATHHARPNLPLFNTEATRRLEQAMAAQLAPHTLMQRAWPGCGATGASHCTACPHDLDCLRPRQQRWRRAGGRAPFGPRWAQSRHQLAGHHRDITARRAPILGKARHCANIVGRHAPTDLTGQDLCIDALLGIGVRSSTRHTPSVSTHDTVLAQWLAQLRSSAAPCWRWMCPLDSTPTQASTHPDWSLPLTVRRRNPAQHSAR